MRAREIFGLIVLVVCARSASGQAVSPKPETRDKVSPLAYVRTLGIAPVTMSLPPDPPRPPMPGSSDKRRLKDWQQHAKSLDQRNALREQAPTIVMQSLLSRLRIIPGLSVLPSHISGSAGPQTAAVNTEDPTGPDAVLRFQIDRFGVQAGVERRIWL